MDVVTRRKKERGGMMVPERLYCLECVRDAAHCGADAGLVDSSVGAIR